MAGLCEGGSKPSGSLKTMPHWPPLRDANRSFGDDENDIQIYYMNKIWDVGVAAKEGTSHSQSILLYKTGKQGTFRQQRVSLAYKSCR
ncbi:hypothetical protein ANN_07554 [Periplaneta americana]|uniref:Uncharacterized protein n=1 Tax=Periplaneta americana TaxID=6978 RepID=A0ABQ8T0G4_PERAM|nr:hypothetical protein ANN_07554 [Periplaneta americana]